MVFKRGKVYWYQFQIDGKRIRESARTTNRTAALNAEGKRRTHVRDGCPVEDKVSFAVAFESFLEWNRSHVKPNTHKRYRVSGKRLKAHFGDEKLSGVGSRNIEAFKTDRIQECSGAGCNRDLACLRTFLNWAATLNYLNQTPFKGIKLFKEPPGQMRILSPEEEELFLANAQQPLYDIAVLMLNTGMRPEEVYSIRGENVNLQDGFIFIPDGKTRAARRTLPLNEEALEVLRRRKRDGYLFPQRRDPQKHMTAYRGHRKVCRKLKLEFRLYDLRHTFGSRMAMAGVDLPTLKELMGHTTIQMTMRYVHPTPEHKVEAIRKLASHKKAHSVKIDVGK